MSDVLNYDNYVTKESKKPSYETKKSRFYSDLKNNPNFQELHQKQLQESKELDKNNELQKQNISKETYETLDKEAIINQAKKYLYEGLGLKENLGENSSLKNFLKGIVDELILGNAELAIEVINTKGEILIDAISKLLTWEGLKKVSVSLGESIWNLFDGDAYEKGKSVADLGLIGTGLGAGVALGKKGLKVGLKQIAKHGVNKENLVKSEGLKNVVKETNSSVSNIIPKKQFDPEKMLIEDIAKLGEQDRVLAGKMLLKRDLSEVEQKAIIEAHNIGENRAEAGINNYNFAEKRQKYIILKNTGFAEEEIKNLMQKGVCGKIPETGALTKLQPGVDTLKSVKERFKYEFDLINDDTKNLNGLYKKDLNSKDRYVLESLNLKSNNYLESRLGNLNNVLDYMISHPGKPEKELLNMGLDSFKNILQQIKNNKNKFRISIENEFKLKVIHKKLLSLN